MIAVGYCARPGVSVTCYFGLRENHVTGQCPDVHQTSLKGALVYATVKAN